MLDPINHRARFNQVRNFAGMKFGTITPSDIDMTIEYHNERRVLGEFKYADTQLLNGQRWLLERFTMDFIRAGKPSIAFIAKHFVSDCSKDIICAEAVVEEVFLGDIKNGKPVWTPVASTFTALDLCNWFITDSDKLWVAIYAF
jgi:hypothetical protein